MKTRPRFGPRDRKPNLAAFAAACLLSLAAGPAASAPFITDVSPTTGAWGTLVTITGAGFGALQGNSVVTFSRLETTAVSSWSDTQIVVGVPSRAVPGNVVVSLKSTKDRAFGVQVLTLTQWEDSNGVLFTVAGAELDEAIADGDIEWEEQTYGNEVPFTDTLNLPWATILAQGADFGLIPSTDPEDTPGELDPTRNLSSGWVGIRKIVDGGVRYGTTCVLCHEGRHPLTGTPIGGLPNVEFDLGKMFALSPVFTQAQKDCLLLWGPGRMDVGALATGSFCNPGNTPPHIFTTGFSSLEWTGLAISLDARNTSSVQLEAGQRVPTAAELMYLAVYGYMLDQVVENPNVDPLAAKRGRQVFFDSGCSDCHSPHLGRYSNLDSIPLSVIGTDPDLTSGGTIATGFYRVAPLANLWATPPYLHDGTLATIEEIFDEARLDPNFVATGTPPAADKPGGVLGHEFAFPITWTPQERADLIEFLKSVPDNCPGVPNPAQTDTDGDGIGDACEASLVPMLEGWALLILAAGLLVVTSYVVRRLGAPRVC